ncbi:hypothetical protein HanIR_Chr09g0440931 [Helianthus annuus]|nr:hypothetical protein HanIR_Chr09g0440931 [Helianthus annuus]
MFKGTSYYWNFIKYVYFFVTGNIKTIYKWSIFLQHIINRESSFVPTNILKAVQKEVVF